MKDLLHKMKENKSIIHIMILFVIAFGLMIPSFQKNTDIYYDDGSQHLMRAYGTYQTFKQDKTKQIISKFTNGFGYSWNLFYGPLSADLILLFGVLFGTFNLGFKFALFVIVFISGVFMYKFIIELTDSENTALLAGIIYITSPYFFTDIYTRHAIGEAMAFVFVPMVFLGLYNLFNTEKNHYYLIVGASGLILSHNISTVLTLLFAGIYCLINFKNWSSTHVKKGLLIDIAFIILITSFYWMPFLEAKFFTNYQVYEKDAMSSQESFLAHALSIKDLFITKNYTSYFFEIGLPVLLMLAFSGMTYRRLTENKKEYLFFLISGLLSIWMATKYFPWKWLPNSVYIIQLPWRMMVFSTFFFAVVTSINMANLIVKFNLRDVMIIAAICFLFSCSLMQSIPKAEYVPEVRDYSIYPVTGQNNEWLPGMGRLEYLPTKAHNNTFYIATRKNEINLISGNATVQDAIKIGNYMIAKITTEEEVELELPYMYYPGYTVRFDGIILSTFETENGFIGCNLPKNEDGTLEVKYTGTKLMHLSKIISIISGIIFLIYVWKKH